MDLLKNIFHCNLASFDEATFYVILTNNYIFMQPEKIPLEVKCYKMPKYRTNEQVCWKLTELEGTKYILTKKRENICNRNV